MQSHPDILVAYPDWNYIGPSSELIFHVQVPEYNYLYMLTRHECVVGPGAFIRRKAFGLIGMRDPEFRYVADFDFWLRLGLYGEFARIPKTLATFRVHPGSTTVHRRGPEMANEHIRLIQKFYSRSDLPPEVYKVRAAALSRAHYIAAGACGLAHDVARKHYFKFLQYHPTFLGEYRCKLKALSSLLPWPIFNILCRSWETARPIPAKGHQLLKRLLGTMVKFRESVKGV